MIGNGGGKKTALPSSASTTSLKTATTAGDDDDDDGRTSNMDGVETRFVAETLLPTRLGKFRLRGYLHTVRSLLFFFFVGFEQEPFFPHSISTLTFSSSSYTHKKKNQKRSTEERPTPSPPLS